MLFEILLKQIDLRGKEKLIIVPDGELWQMTFQALIAPNDKFLIESAQIACTQSLTTLSEMRKTLPENRLRTNSY